MKCYYSNVTLQSQVSCFAAFTQPNVPYTVHTCGYIICGHVCIQRLASAIIGKKYRPIDGTRHELASGNEMS